MDLLRTYDFDCLTYIDTEYDNPVVQEAVTALITQEMRSFAPQTEAYLEHMPYPALKYAEMAAESAAAAAKIRAKGGAEGSSSSEGAKLDMKRYEVPRPEPGLENDVQAWRKCVANAKAQFGHQQNRVINLELADKHVAALWLSQNRILEKSVLRYEKEYDEVAQSVTLLNRARKRKQEEEQYPQLASLYKRRDQALVRKLMIQKAFAEAHAKLSAQGHNFWEFYDKKLDLERNPIDVNSAEHNSTVMEYERVNVSCGGEGEDKSEKGVNDSSSR